MDYYELMHRDCVVAIFLLDGDRISSVSFRNNALEHLPISVTDKKSFIRWIGERAIPAARLGIEKITDSPFRLLIENNALSLTDNYWVRSGMSDAAWNDVNFYENDFRATYVLDNLDNQPDIQGKTNFSPSASLKGDLKKKWVIMGENRRVLVKGNYGRTALQSVSEVIASKIYERLAVIDYADYSFVRLTSDGQEILGCCCENYTTQDLEFIPAIDIANSLHKENDMSYYQAFVDECNAHGIYDAARFLSIMFSVDFLLVNVDRHLNNFGILRDPVSLQWKCMAPVYDTGNSLFYDWGMDACLPAGNRLLKTKINSFYGTMAKQMKVVDVSLLNLERVISEEEFYGILSEDSSLTQFDKEQRVTLYQTTKRLFAELQNGADLWRLRNR